MLYEIAYAYIGLAGPDTPMSLYSVLPRRKLPVNVLLTDITLHTPAVLVTEYDVHAEDPLVYLTQVLLLYFVFFVFEQLLSLGHTKLEIVL